MADGQEAEQTSLIKMNKELADHAALKSKVEMIYNEIKAEDKTSTNTTDADCKPMRSVQGSHAAYNVQSTVDEKHAGMFRFTAYWNVVPPVWMSVLLSWPL